MPKVFNCCYQVVSSNKCNQLSLVPTMLTKNIANITKRVKNILKKACKIIKMVELNPTQSILRTPHFNIGEYLPMISSKRKPNCITLGGRGQEVRISLNNMNNLKILNNRNLENTYNERRLKYIFSTIYLQNPHICYQHNCFTKQTHLYLHIILFYSCINI